MTCPVNATKEQDGQGTLQRIVATLPIVVSNSPVGLGAEAEMTVIFTVSPSQVNRGHGVLPYIVAR